MQVNSVITLRYESKDVSWLMRFYIVSHSDNLLSPKLVPVEHTLFHSLNLRGFARTVEPSVSHCRTPRTDVRLPPPGRRRVLKGHQGTMVCWMLWQHRGCGPGWVPCWPCGTSGALWHPTRMSVTAPSLPRTLKSSHRSRCGPGTHRATQTLGYNRKLVEGPRLPPFVTPMDGFPNKKVFDSIYSRTSL